MNVKSDKNFNVTNKNKKMELEMSTIQQVYSGVTVILGILIMLGRTIFEIIKVTVQKFVPPSEKSVQGEVVLITGCGHGIGKELALQYASLGATVVGWDLNLATCEETMKEIAKIGGPKAHAYKCDVTNRQQILELAKKVKQEVGDVTILINNAGIMPCHPLLEHTETEIKKVMDINVMAHFWMLEAFLPSMLENNHGHIVALSSMSGVMGLTNLVPYCTSKFAVRGMMEALAEELRETKPGNQVKCTCICPYIVDTGMCKNPNIRCPKLMPLLTTQDVAKIIITAQRRDVVETTIPSCLHSLVCLMRLIPYPSYKIWKDYFYCGAYTDEHQVKF